MNDFIFHNPDKVYFGKNQLEHLPEELLKFGKKVLLVYGGGSIKRSGLYDEVTRLMKENDMEVFELSGVESKLRHSTADKFTCTEKMGVLSSSITDMHEQ